MTEYVLFHTADLHSGAYRFVADYLQRCSEMFDGIFKKVTSIPGQQILVVAGDACDRKNLTEEERNLMISFFVRCLKAGVIVVVVNGNHDYYTESLTMLEPLKIMSELHQNLHVVLGNPKRVTIGDIGFGCVPCQQDLTTDKLEQIARKLRKEADCSKFYMVVHEAVYGSSNYKGTWKAKSDKYLKIPDLSFVTGWMLGDIHQRQQISRNAWYSGAPIQVKSDESPNTGILQWTGSKVAFHSIPTRGFRFTSNVKEAIAFAEDGHYVRFKGKVPDGVEFPPNVAIDGDLAAVELDIDFAGDEAVDEFTPDFDLITPLPKFLAARGMQPHHQRMAVEIVSGIMQSKNHVEPESSDEED
jgi:hypothetical protein